MNDWKGAFAIGAAIAFGTGVANAQDTDRNLLDITCSQYLTALSATNPPASASRAQKDLAAQAQDDISSGLLWVHGYLAGRAVSNGSAPPPLTRAWMASMVPTIAKACKAPQTDGDPLITAVVDRL